MFYYPLGVFFFAFVGFSHSFLYVGVSLVRSSSVTNGSLTVLIR